MRPSSWKWSLVPSCCGGTTRNKEQHCVVPKPPVLDFLEWPRSLSERLRGGKCLGRPPSPPSPPLLVFDQSNRINSPLDSPTDLVAAAPKLSNKHVRVVPPASCDTTQASSACTDLIRNTMPFIFGFFSGSQRAGGREGGWPSPRLQQWGCWSLSILLFLLRLSPPAIQQGNEWHILYCLFFWFGLFCPTIFHSLSNTMHCYEPHYSGKHYL